MTVTITPLAASHGCTLGATVTDVDLHTLDDAQWRVIEQAFDEHALLVLPGQHPSDAAQLAFAQRFGPIEILVQGKDTVAISNRSERGQELKPGQAHRMVAPEVSGRPQLRRRKRLAVGELRPEPSQGVTALVGQGISEHG